MPEILFVTLVGIPVVLALVAEASFFANLQFNKDVNKEVGQFFSGMESKRDIIQRNDLEGLPPVVQKWLERSRVVGKERIEAVRLKQKVSMRIKEEGPWMPAAGEVTWKLETGDCDWYRFEIKEIEYNKPAGCR
ncbi:DUF6920 family protein [Desulfoscipio geothermicus]|uniref:Uncharacterized protein n=1 Tax=Desulfoscipio geothermicus DSM 3669 TaxID=1121426 RepID=A0A1I6DZM6_9FIRM|nr:DUF6544 family protein [Desulfoscipio geothermicus]SFR10970.1 hypothetical protein SAMN05660706_12221 [Desulfoscipio geothermicus DSM 3669]